MHSFNRTLRLITEMDTLFYWSVLVHFSVAGSLVQSFRYQWGSLEAGNISTGNLKGRANKEELVCREDQWAFICSVSCYHTVLHSSNPWLTAGWVSGWTDQCRVQSIACLIINSMPNPSCKCTCSSEPNLKLLSWFKIIPTSKTLDFRKILHSVLCYWTR